MTSLLRIGALVLAAAYAVSGVWGVRAATAYRRGYVLAGQGKYRDALPLLERGAVGFNAAEAHWLAGEVLMGLADAARESTTREEAMRRGARHYVDMLRMTTGSAYGLAGLASVYERNERIERSRRVTDLSTLFADPWAAVGSDGRVAVGLLRLATAREPSVCAPHDALVHLLVGYGLLEEAKTAARDAALAAPAFESHDDLDPGRLPPEVVAAFADGARAALDEAPLASRERKLFSLGLLEERTGHLQRAADYLAAAHAQPAPEVQHAETAYHLGRVLVSLGRIREAEAVWKAAEQSPVFRRALAIERARLAEAEGRADEALRQVAVARRADPRQMGLILWEARLLAARGNRAAAADTLKWGITVDGSDRLPRAALVEVLIASGERVAANEALTEFERRLGEGDDTRALRARLESAP